MRCDAMIPGTAGGGATAPTLIDMLVMLLLLPRRQEQKEREREGGREIEARDIAKLPRDVGGCCPGPGGGGGQVPV